MSPNAPSSRASWGSRFSSFLGLPAALPTRQRREGRELGPPTDSRSQLLGTRTWNRTPARRAGPGQMTAPGRVPPGDRVLWVSNAICQLCHTPTWLCSSVEPGSWEPLQKPAYPSARAKVPREGTPHPGDTQGTNTWGLGLRLELNPNNLLAPPLLERPKGTTDTELRYPGGWAPCCCGLSLQPGQPFPETCRALPQALSTSLPLCSLTSQARALGQGLLWPL